MSTDNRNAPLSYGEMVPKIEPDDTDGKPAALTIRRARRQNFSKNPNRDDVKVVIEFAEAFDAKEGFNESSATRREYVVNSGSYQTLCMQHGDDETKWIGKTIVMAPTQTKFDGKTFDKLHVATPDRWSKVVAATAKAATKRR